MDLTQEKLSIDDYYNRDLNDYINDAFEKADRNFARIFEALTEISTTLGLTTGSWFTFTGGGVTYRIGSDTDGVMKIQQALTALGFNGTESTDQGATGDYITLVPFTFGQD
jgi:hypothetical protein